QDAAIADAAAVLAHEDVDPGCRYGQRVRPMPDHAAPSLADRGERLRRVHLGLVVEVLADAGLAADAGPACRRRAVLVEDARLGGGRRAVARRRVGVAAVEDPASEPDDLVPLTRPRESLERSVLPLETHVAGRVAGARAVDVCRIERDLEDGIAGDVGRWEVATGVAVEGVDRAMDGDGSRIHRHAVYDRCPLGV